MANKYFVELNTHNAKTDAWNYKQTKAFDDLDAAKKEFHNIFSTYINYGDLDHVGAIIWDAFARVLMTDYWHKPQAPEETEE